MRKFILPVLLCIIFINPATANDEINSLLKTLDKALKYKLDYAEQKQEQIDSLKIELKLHHKIRKKVQIAELLCFAYSSFQKDSALTYAIHMNELAQESGDGELIIEAKLDYASSIPYNINYCLPNLKWNTSSGKPLSTITRRILLPVK